MDWDFLKWLLCLLVILLFATLIYLGRLKIHGVTTNDRKRFSTQFLITILGTAVGFSFVTITSVYFQRINDKSELLMLLANAYKEADIAYKSLLFNSQLGGMTYSDKQLLSRSGPLPRMKIDSMFVGSLYQNENSYRYLSKDFTKNRLFVIHRGMQNCAERSERESFFHDGDKLKAVILQLKIYLGWLEKEGIFLSGSKEEWEKTLNLFDLWTELTIMS